MTDTPSLKEQDKQYLLRQLASDLQTGSSPLIRLLQRYNIPVTRENYLDLAFWAKPPDPLSVEDEAELPAMVEIKEASERMSPPEASGCLPGTPCRFSGTEAGAAAQRLGYVGRMSRQLTQIAGAVDNR